MSKFSRRAFLGGSMAVAGGLLVADHLRFLEPSTGELVSSEELLTGKEVVYRTGHSNNCDGACGRLVHVTDGRVTMIGPASWGATTVSGEQTPTFHPESACGASRRSRTPTARTASSTPTSGWGHEDRGSGSGSAGTRRPRSLPRTSSRFKRSTGRRLSG